MGFVEILAGLSVMLFLLAGPPYIIDTLKGRTKPERATWFIWSVLGIIAFISQVSLGASWSLVFTGLDTFGSLLVLGLSLRYGVGGWAVLDRIALVIAGVGAVTSLIVQQPIVALLGVILADISGTVLTIRKTLRHPNSETTISWLLVGTGALCGVLSVRHLDFGLLIYPLYLLVANYSIPLAQVIGRAYQRSHTRSTAHASDS